MLTLKDVKTFLIEESYRAVLSKDDARRANLNKAIANLSKLDELQPK